jgi:hypothetical protein
MSHSTDSQADSTLSWADIPGKQPGSRVTPRVQDGNGLLRAKPS